MYVFVHVCVSVCMCGCVRVRVCAHVLVCVISTVGWSAVYIVVVKCIGSVFSILSHCGQKGKCCFLCGIDFNVKLLCPHF